MQILAYQKRVFTNCQHDLPHLLIGDSLDQLLNEVVAEGVPHQIRKIFDSCIEHDLAHVFIFNLLL